MLTNTRPEAVAEPEQVLLVDALQYPVHGLLDDLVLQRRDTQRTLASVGLGYPDSTRGLCPVGSPVNASVEVRDIGLQVALIFMPCHAVDGAFFFRLRNASVRHSSLTWCSKAVNLSAPSFRAASRTPCNPRNLRFVRLGVRRKTACSAFLLAGSLSSDGSAGAPAAPLFAVVAGTMDPSDFLLAFMSALPSETFSDRSAGHRACTNAKRKLTGSPGSRA